MRDARLTQREYVPDGMKGVVTIGASTHGIEAGAVAVVNAVREAIEQQDLHDVDIKIAGDSGFFTQDALVKISLSGKPPVLYGRVTPELVPRLITQHLAEGAPVVEHALCQIPSAGRRIKGIPSIDDLDFFFRQHPVLSWRCGHIDPARIDDAFRTGAYRALATAMEKSASEVVESICSAQVYDRGGSGENVAERWAEAAASPDDPYIVCNALEVEPASVKDRLLLESDPHAVIEGMIITAYAVGARIGYLVVNPSYTLAQQRVEIAVAQARRHRRLGRGIRGGAFDFDVIVVRGPANYVTGEETALVSFLDGGTEPRLTPPSMAESGLSGRPTLVANAETFAQVPTLPFEDGRARPWATRLCTLEGTFNTGVVEVEDDTTLRTLICHIGDTPEDHVKAIVVGGHIGGVLPPDQLDAPLTSDACRQLGVRPGAGLVSVIDTSTDLMTWLRDHLRFAARESCGQCTPCREGMEQARRIAERLCDGDGRADDLNLLDRLATYVASSSLCGYGHAVPAGVVTAMRHFGDEIRAGITRR